MVVAGTMHFIIPGLYVRMMPDYLPDHLPMVYLSGFLEVSFGILLLVERCRRFAAWGIFALLIAVFPANVFLFQNQQIIPAPPFLHLLRLPMQGVFLLWAFWFTRPAKPGN